MRRLAAALVCVAITSAAPAFAADEPEDPTPSTGGPVITIPVDPGQVSALVIVDVALQPATGVAPGGSVRLTGRLATGASPDRIVVVVDGSREAVGNVEPAADGAIDHTITLPSDLAPGRHTLSLRADGLGIAPLGAIEVVAAAPGTDPPRSSEAPSAPDASSVPPQSPPQQASSPESEGGVAADDTTGASGVPLLIALVAAATAAVALSLRLRRNRRVGHIAAATALPTATRVPGRPSTTAVDDDPAPPRTPPLPDEAPRSGEAATSNGVAVGASASVEEAEAEGPPKVHPAFVVVRLTVTTGDDAAEPVEEVAAECDSLEAAKRTARNLRSQHQPSPAREVWWEVREPGHAALWMLHAWAPREYDLDVDSGRAAPHPKG